VRTTAGASLLPPRGKDKPEAAPRLTAAAIARSSRVALGAVGLLGLTVGSLAIVIVADDRHSFLSPPSRAGFPAWMSGPLGGLLPHLTHNHHAIAMGFSFAMIGMYVCYLLLIACVPALRAPWVIGAAVAIHVIFFLSTPLPLTDLFNYLNYGRMGVVHGLNPYAHNPVLVSHDPAYRFTTWHHLHSPYGPLFTLITYALVPLGVAASYWAFKLVVMLSSLACLWLIWKCALELGRSPLQAIAFVAFNPLVLVFGLGGAHNDFLMMALVLAGVYLILRLREPLGAGAIVAAVAIKASAGLLLPLVLLGARRSLRAAGGGLVVAVALAAASLALFGTHLPNDAAQSKLVVPFGLANLVGLALGLGGVTAHMRLALELIMLAGLLLSCGLVLRGRVHWVHAAGWVTLLFLLTLTWVMPWYVLWLLPFAALARRRELRVAALVFGVFLLFNWVPLGQHLGHDTLNIKPTRTQVGRQNQAYVHRLLF
jgi:hypothetical protein